MARAKKNDSAGNGPKLFDAQLVKIERRIRRQRALFIPHMLRQSAASEQALNAEARANAFKIVQHWAGLEKSGWLRQQKETAIDTQFLDDVFGKALGYTLRSDNPKEFQLDHKFTVPEVGIADGALGNFPTDPAPTVVIELKDANTDLDRDRSNGRTAVQQCWDYLTAQPQCVWGIVSNFSTIRLYHRDRGSLAYEEFTLQELAHPEKFAEFYYLFERGGLLRSAYLQNPRALDLLKRTQERQRTVGDELYRAYQLQRLRLIENLMDEHRKDFDTAVHVAQKLLDRVIFIAFCEDRDLLKPKVLDRAWREVAPFSHVTNPRWQNFLQLFEAVDKGGKPGAAAGVEQGYNGSLFKPDPEIDNLDLDDDWTQGFRNLGEYDFSEEVNVEVLGHLFERSITELEKLRVGGLFALKAGVEGAPQPVKKKRGRGKTAPVSKMPKSAQRKRFGIYYTPPAFTALLVERTVDVVVAERFAALREKLKVDPESREAQDPAKLLKYWRGCLDELKSITVCDPACGSGAFLIQAYEVLDGHYKAVMHGLAGAGMDAAKVRELEDSIPDLILGHNLYGVDLSEQGVEITQLALWIRSARKDKRLSDLSKHIIWGNSLVSDPEVDPKALDWHKAFPHIFGKGSPGGFTCVIGNPPWERVKLQKREFFSFVPEVIEEPNASRVRKILDSFETTRPELFQRWQTALEKASATASYIRDCGAYPLTGRGDLNYAMNFAELAGRISSATGVAGILVPSGIATDNTTKEFFQGLMDSKRLASLYDFENRSKVFEDVDGRFKFSALVFGGSKRVTERADFVFFAQEVQETASHYKQRHIPLTAADMALLNPNTRTCPIFRTRRDAELTKDIYKRVPILIDRNRKQGGNQWSAQLGTMFHQSGDAGLFKTAEKLKSSGYVLQGNCWQRGEKRLLPLYEAKMVQAFDHRAAGVVTETENWVRHGQTIETIPVAHQNPEFAVMPRFWVSESKIIDVQRSRFGSLCYKNITSATNTRTMIAAYLPAAGYVDSLNVLSFGDDVRPRLRLCLLANLNAFGYDYIARQKVGGLHLSYFIVEQLPTLPPDTYADRCPWSPDETLEQWVSERVLKLSCTADDMIPLAQACGFKGSRGDGVHIWKESERAQLRAELDAAYFILYGIERPDVEYILSTFTNTGLSEKSSGQKYLYEPGRPGAMILEAYDRLKGA